MRKRLILPLIVLTLLALVVIPASAFEFSNEEWIPADQVIDDDLFLEAEKVIVDGTVNGNLFVNAAQITINGPINGNLLIFGAIVEVNGPVSGSIAFVGQSLQLNSRVTGSVFAGGASLVLNPEAVIERNLYFSGYGAQTMPGSQIGVDASLACSQAVLQGEVGRDVHAGLVGLELEGRVGRNVFADVEPPGGQGINFALMLGDSATELPVGIASGLRVAETASVGGTLTYISTVEQANTIAIPSGQVVYQAREVEKKLGPVEDFQKRLLGAGRDWITLLILGFVMLKLLDRPMQRAGEATRRVLPALGWGLVVLLVTPLALVLVGALVTVLSLLLGVVTLEGLSIMVAVGGYIALALVTLIFLIILFYVSKLVVALAVGGWLYRRIWPEGEMKPIWPLLMGVTLFVLLSLIPLGGGALIGILVTLAGLGALWMTIRPHGFLAATPHAPAPEAGDNLSDHHHQG